MAAVRSLARHEWRAYRDIRLSALVDSPDAFASVLEREQVRSDQEWSQRVAAGVASEADLPLVIEDEGGLAGLAWGKFDFENPDTVWVLQMWVAPARRGRGYGQELLSAIIDWARESGVRRVTLRVALDNVPARALYESAGFEGTGDVKPLRPGADLMQELMQLTLDRGGAA
ncbi:MAG: GNAT family N-acetyltransferase [Vicinamibacterales bacterium]